VRVSAIVGVFFLLAGLLLLYVLRQLLVQVLLVLLGIAGLIIGLVFVIFGIALIFGKFWIRGRIKRYLTYRLLTEAISAASPI
jgi:hypothetical protein